MIKFPKIRQFRDVIKHVRTQHDFQGFDDEDNAIYEHQTPYPQCVSFTGTVKLHGTNAAIVIDSERNITVQSRSREITVENDNAGFAAFVAGLPKSIIDGFSSDVAIFGEFAGGNIQKGVAINSLPKMFVIFAIKYLEGDGKWTDISKWSFPTELLNSNGIYIINQFPTFEIEIDFNSPEFATEKLQEITLEVEKECPVGKYFGVSGVGEGIVWQAVGCHGRDHVFKVKGEKHSVSKVKTLAPVDIEKLQNVQEFVEMTVTLQRLEQGIATMLERDITIERKNTGDFLRWVIGDIMSEELDQLTGNDLCAKDVNKSISEKARPFWFDACDSNF